MREPTEQERWEQLQIRVMEAHTALKANEHRDLTFRHVMRILATFGPYANLPLLYGGEFSGIYEAALRGWRRRAWNALLCAEKVLPFWLETKLVDSNLEELLPKARQIIQKGNPKEPDTKLQIDPTSDNFSYKFQGKQATKGTERALSAYYVAQSAIRTVSWDIKNEFELDSYYDDLMGDWLTMPTVFQTSRIFAEVHDDSPLHAQAREEFWLWWLDEAVPASWDLKDI